MTQFLKSFQEEQDRILESEFNKVIGFGIFNDKSGKEIYSSDILEVEKSYIHSREEALCEKIAADLARILPVGEVNALDIIRAVEKYRQELLCQ